MIERDAVATNYESLTDGSELERTDVVGGTSLVLGWMRASEATVTPLTVGGTIISLGCGKEPFLPAFSTLKPSKVIGVDIDAQAIAKANETWANSSPAYGFPSEFITADAGDADTILGQVQLGDPIRHVLLLQPRVENDPGSAVDQKYRQMVKTWLEKIPQDGQITICTYTDTEMMVFLNDPDIRQHLVVYGTTDLMHDMDGSGNHYIAQLGKAVNASEPKYLDNRTHYIENTLVIDPADSPADQAEALRFTEEEADDLAADDFGGYWPDLPYPLPPIS